MITRDELNTLLPLSTAGALPSSRTEGMLQEALDTDDIQHVKSQLAHIWGHYQSLEFMVNALATDPADVIKAAHDTGIIETVAEAEAMHAAFRIAAEVFLLQAYQAGHTALDGLSYGLSVPDSLRNLYPQLDHSDPEREVTDYSIDEALAQWERELLDIEAEEADADGESTTD